MSRRPTVGNHLALLLFFAMVVGGSILVGLWATGQFD